MARKTKESKSTAFLTLEELEEQKKDLEKAIPGLQWGDDPDLEVISLPLDIHAIDDAMNGGFPFSRISLIWGDQAAGKTTFCLFVIKKAQEQGLACAYLDIEKKLDLSWAKLIGVDVTRLAVIRPSTTEDTVGALSTLLERNFGVVVLDSLAALSTQAELDADPEKKFMGELAKSTNDVIRKINSKNNQTMILMVNQVREKIGMVFGNPELMPGGRAQRFFSTMIVRLRRGDYIDEGTGDKKHKVGYNLRVIVEKDQHGTPFKEAEVPFYFTGKIDEESALVATAISLDVITRSGPYYTFGEDKVLGQAGLVDRVKSDPEFRQRLEDALNAIKDVDE